MKKIAIIDIDDTLADLRNPMCNSLNIICEEKYHWTQWTGSSSVETLYGISTTELLGAIEDDLLLENLEPHAEVAHFMRLLHELDYYVVFLTARAWHPSGEAITEKWLKKNNIEYDRLIVCPLEANKAEIVKANFECVDFAVDDSVRHCVSYSNEPIIKNVYVYDLPWNRNIDVGRAKRITSLTQILGDMHI